MYWYDIHFFKITMCQLEILKLWIKIFIFIGQVNFNYQKTVPFDVVGDESSLAINACKKKINLIQSEKSDRFEIVRTYLNGKLTLFCRYCDENDDNVPKIWYHQNRLDNAPPVEVQLGMDDKQISNRVYVKSDHSLVIMNITEKDSGLYFCSGPLGDDSEYNFNYIVDVQNGTIPTILGTLEGWFKYQQEVFEDVNLKFETSQLPDYLKIRELGIIIKARSNWGKWGPCDGCRKIRKKISVCILIPILAKNETESKNNTRETKEIDALKARMLLLKSFEISCHSLDFEKLFPDISKELANIKNYGITEACYAPCTFQSSNALYPHYKNTVILTEGDHFTLTCPEVSLESQIVWRKNGIPIEPNVRGGDIIVDIFSNLEIVSATSNEEANFTCYVDDVKMQEIIIVVNKKLIVTTKAFFRHIQYLGLIFLFSVIFYTAGQIITWNRRHTFKKIDLNKHAKEFSRYKIKKPSVL